MNRFSSLKHVQHVDAYILNKKNKGKKKEEKLRAQ